MYGEEKGFGVYFFVVIFCLALPDNSHEAGNTKVPAQISKLALILEGGNLGMKTYFIISGIQTPVFVDSLCHYCKVSQLCHHNHVCSGSMLTAQSSSLSLTTVL